MGFNGYWSPTSKIKNWLIKNKGPNIAFISESDLWESLASIEAKDEQYMCDLMQINLKDWEPSTVDWMYPKNSILQPMFDKFMLDLNEKGIIKRIEDMFSNKKICKESNDYQQMTFDYVKILFALLILGLISAILIGIYEKIFLCVTKKYKKVTLENKEEIEEINMEITSQSKIMKNSSTQTDSI